MSWQTVYKLVKKIPRGRVTTYGRIGTSLKLPGTGRTAGRAMAACPSGQGIPWHRVVGAGGRLVMGEPHVSLQRRMLESEGIRFAERRIQDFANVVWEPKRQKSRSRH